MWERAKEREKEREGENLYYLIILLFIWARLNLFLNKSSSCLISFSFATILAPFICWSSLSWTCRGKNRSLWSLGVFTFVKWWNIQKILFLATYSESLQLSTILLAMELFYIIPIQRENVGWSDALLITQKLLSCSLCKPETFHSVLCWWCCPCRWSPISDGELWFHTPPLSPSSVSTSPPRGRYH